MYCNKCGSAITENEKYCENCGADTVMPTEEWLSSKAGSKNFSTTETSQPEGSPMPVKPVGAPEQSIDVREKLEKKYNTSRGTLFFIIAFTCVNIMLVLLNSGSYFLFSASIPMFFLFLGSELVELNGTISVSIYGVVGAFISVAIYGSIYFLIRNHRAWIIAALVYFSIDVLIKFALFLTVPLLVAARAFSIIELVIMTLIMYRLIIGTIAWSKLRKLPP